jgi:hypothetical protein
MWIRDTGCYTGHGDWQWRVEQSSGASEFEATGEMALLFVEVVTE